MDPAITDDFENYSKYRKMLLALDYIGNNAGMSNIVFDFDKNMNIQKTEIQIQN